MLLCQFLVLAGNRLLLYILLCTWSTIQLWCCVSYFGSGGKYFLVLRTYLVYNTDRYYDRKKKSEKKSSSHLSGRCAIVITTGKKSSSRLSGGCAIVIMTGIKKSSSRDFYVKLNVSNKFVLVLALIDLIHFEHPICISST